MADPENSVIGGGGGREVGGGHVSVLFSQVGRTIGPIASRRWSVAEILTLS